MNVFERFLIEAFPPKKSGSQGPKGKKPFGPKKPVAAEDAGNDTPFDKKKAGGFPPKQGGGFPPNAGGADDDPEADGDQTELWMMQQQADQERERAELEARRQKEVADQQEHQRVKEMRSRADDEVAAALEDKFNDSDDSVTFYPELDPFSQFGDKEDGKDEDDKDDDDVDEEDEDDENDAEEEGDAEEDPESDEDGKHDDEPSDDEPDEEQDDEEVEDDEKEVKSKSPKDKKPVKEDKKKKSKKSVTESLLRVKHPIMEI